MHTRADEIHAQVSAVAAVLDGKRPHGPAEDEMLVNLIAGTLVDLNTLAVNSGRIADALELIAQKRP